MRFCSRLGGSGLIPDSKGRKDFPLEASSMPPGLKSGGRNACPVIQGGGLCLPLTHPLIYSVVCHPQKPGPLDLTFEPSSGGRLSAPAALSAVREHTPLMFWRVG